MTQSPATYVTRAVSMMDESQASVDAYMARALAQGALLTEAGTDALMNNGQIYVDETFGETVRSLKPKTPQEIATTTMSQGVADYIETLERYVATAAREVEEEWGPEARCLMCTGRHPDHADDCIVPALLEKYLDGEPNDSRR